MIKKVLWLCAVILLFAFPLVLSANETQVNKAYSCLEDKVGNCTTLSLQAQIFSRLAIGKCEKQIFDKSHDDECWPEEKCSVKTTSQVLLAVEGNTKAEKWLLEQNVSAEGLIWYLQIDSDNSTACTISYAGEDYNIEIGEDKKIDSDAGDCLSLDNSDYWLKISPSCYDEEFSISCDENFFTNLLFKKEDSSTIHVSETTSSAYAEGTTTEKVNSLCFKDEAGNCDYEGTLWAVLALDSLGSGTEAYLPYLVSSADEHPELLPESFLYIFTDYEDFQNTLISKQATSGYWQASGDKFYDTALALLALDSADEAKAKTWLLNVQDKDGCWNSGNIADTAFLIYSAWPKTTAPFPNEKDCGDMYYYCMSDSACSAVGGAEKDYDCPSFAEVCCDKPLVLETCENMNGEECASDEQCSGVTRESSDVFDCCVDGSCEKPVEVYDCEIHNGTCETFECPAGYTETSNYLCEYEGDVCCVAQEKPETHILIWILGVLIILVLLGIIFRNKLRELLFRLKPGKPAPREGPGAFPRFPPSGGGEPRRVMQRQILPSPMHSRTAPPRKPGKTHGELDEVLKKLKDMSR